MLKMHIIRTRITFKFMLWLAVPVGVASFVVFGVDPVIGGGVNLDTDDDVIIGLLSDALLKGERTHRHKYIVYIYCETCAHEYIEITAVNRILAHFK